MLYHISISEWSWTFWIGTPPPQPKSPFPPNTLKHMVDVGVVFFLKKKPLVDYILLHAYIINLSHLRLYKRAVKLACL